MTPEVEAQAALFIPEPEPERATKRRPTSPTQLTLRYLRDQGWLAQVVERYSLSGERLEALRERFESYVYPDPNSGCFIWCGAREKCGYGSFRVARNLPGACGLVKAHQAAWLLADLPCPAIGLELCHKCDTPSCVNPDHLVARSHAGNMRDMAAKWRAAKGALPYGVHPVKGRYHARARIGGATRHLGSFPTVDEAHAAAVAAKLAALGAG